MAVLLLGEGKAGGVPDEETLRLAQFLASSLVPTLAAQNRWAEDRHVSAETLRFLVSALEARNPYLRGHSQRTALLAERIGMRLGMKGAELSRLTTAALLYDIGWFEINAAFWSKEGPLGPEDWKLVKRHPEEGARILTEASWPESVVAAVRHHHERWDGTGYPQGLRQQAIPWPARIIAVADALEALTRPRAHRPALSLADALRLLRDESEIQFDPNVVDVVRETPECVAVSNPLTANLE
jgi:HD-GYP domain-containing protein (c-di-GMP phosphodiesterase class II)